MFSFAVCLLVAVQSQAQLRVRQDGVTTMGMAVASKIDVGESWSFPESYGVHSMLFYAKEQRPENISICGYTYGGPSPESTGIAELAIGVKGEARGGFKNYGLYGFLSASESFLNYGAAVYGSVNRTFKTLGDNYAGYFDGRVGMSGVLHVEGSIQTPSLTANRIYTRTITMTDTKGLAATQEVVPSLSKQLSTLQLSTFYSDEEEAVEREADSSSPRLADALTENEEESKMHYGIPADQLEAVFPDLVRDNKDGTKSVNYVEMVPILVQVINELSAKVSALQQKLDGTPSVRKVQATTGVESPAESLDIVSMGQNSPNPFGSSSVIPLNIPANAQQACINIYDLSGKQVKRMTVTARGTTSVTVYAEGLSAGIYIYTLVVDGQVCVTRKMMVTE